MLSSIFVGIVLACIFTRAQVFPNFPAGDVQTAGKPCHIAWSGDKNSTTAWKDMSIQFMTGDNLNMVHLTTVTAGRDGTVDGSFDWICPEVTPNAAIYFYQFRSPHTSIYEWTTRFPIVSSSGQITSPPNSTQPDGKPIPWGTGALANPSIALPAPVFTTATLITSTVPRKPPTSSATPTNIAPEVASGCTSFFTQTSLFCNQITEFFNITIENFEAWNGGASVCNIFQKGLTPGLAYCVAGPTTITADTTTNTITITISPSPVSTPTNVASGVVLGCTRFFTRTTELCVEIDAKYNISVAEFESWNGGAGVCNILESGKAYCIAG
ncbi:hypothetical protein E4T56_gene16361 [Termitomyces sp. T112]|nr:hypothetical protein E4T56_gene16361 [Termitomyces sp. T112]